MYILINNVILKSIIDYNKYKVTKYVYLKTVMKSKPLHQ